MNKIFWGRVRRGVEAKGISGRRVIYGGGIDPIDRQILGRQIFTKQTQQFVSGRRHYFKSIKIHKETKIC